MRDLRNGNVAAYGSTVEHFRASCRCWCGLAAREIFLPAIDNADLQELSPHNDLQGSTRYLMVLRPRLTQNLLHMVLMVSSLNLSSSAYCRLIPGRPISSLSVGRGFYLALSVVLVQQQSSGVRLLDLIGGVHQSTYVDVC